MAVTCRHPRPETATSDFKTVPWKKALPAAGLAATRRAAVEQAGAAVRAEKMVAILVDLRYETGPGAFPLWLAVRPAGSVHGRRQIVDRG